nr:MAG TPA: DNA binding protein [Crassvirales sp.]
MYNEEGEEYRRYPKGNEVRVVRKADILKCIDENIIDKEIALEIVTQCEIDAANYLTNGKWTGIPYMGNIISNISGLVIRQNADLLDAAKEELTEHELLLFRKELVADGNARVKHERYTSYVASKMATRNRDLYNRLVKTKGFSYAKLYMYFYANLTVVGDSNNIGNNDKR